MDDNRYKILVEELHIAQKDESIPKQIECLLKLAEYHYNNSNFEKARISLNNILKLDKKQANTNYYLALIEINENHFHQAIVYLNKELEINPKNHYAQELKNKIEIRFNTPIITLLLVILNLFGYIITYPKISTSQAILYGFSEFNFNIFNAMTSLFFHANIIHFLINMCILLAFGLILEKHIGSIKFLSIYLLSGIIGNFLEIYLVSDGVVIGASAALFGILGALMMREPLMKIKLLGFLDMPIIIVLGAFFSLSFIIDLIYDIGIITGDIAHFSGLLIGIFITGLFYQKTIDVFYNWIFIALGFWIIEYAARNFISNLSIVINLVYVLIGCIFIVYSYAKLKKVVIVGGIENE